VDLKKVIDDLATEKATLSATTSKLEGVCCELKESTVVVCRSTFMSKKLIAIQLDAEKRELENTLKELNAQLQGRQFPSLAFWVLTKTWLLKQMLQYRKRNQQPPVPPNLPLQGPL
jgi:hypothetical protein